MLMRGHGEISEAVHIHDFFIVIEKLLHAAVHIRADHVVMEK